MARRVDGTTHRSDRVTSRNQAALGDDRSDPPGGCEFGWAGRTASLIAELRGHPVRDRRRPLMPSRRSIGPNGHHVADTRSAIADLRPTRAVQSEMLARPVHGSGRRCRLVRPCDAASALVPGTAARCRWRRAATTGMVRQPRDLGPLRGAGFAAVSKSVSKRHPWSRCSPTLPTVSAGFAGVGGGVMRQST